MAGKLAERRPAIQARAFVLAGKKHGDTKRRRRGRCFFWGEAPLHSLLGLENRGRQKEAVAQCSPATIAYVPYHYSLSFQIQESVSCEKKTMSKNTQTKNTHTQKKKKKKTRRTYPSLSGTPMGVLEDRSLEACLRLDPKSFIDGCCVCFFCFLFLGSPPKLFVHVSRFRVDEI